MRRRLLTLLVPTLLSCATSPTPTASARDDASSSVVGGSDREILFSFVEDTVRNRYAPLTFKEEAGWRLDAELAALKEVLLDEGSSAHDVRRSLHGFLRSAHDLHTGATFAGGATVWLGLHLRHTARGYVVAWVDRSVLPLEQYPVGVGDRVIAIDEMDVEEAVRAAEARTQWRSTPSFTQRLAEWMLVVRSSSEWGEVPSVGTSISLTLESPARQRSDVELTWRDAATMPGPASEEPCPYWGRTPASYVPELGSVLWRSKLGKTVQAYVFSAGGRRFGVVRIHTYARSGQEARLAIAEFDDAIDAFQSQGVQGLVLDQTGNEGGSFPFALTMLSRLSDRPLVAPEQRYLRGPDGQIVGYDPGALVPVHTALRSINTEREARAAFESVPLLEQLGYLPPTVTTIQGVRGFLEFVSSEGAPGELTEPHYQVLPRYVLDPDRGPAFAGSVLVVLDALNISAAEYVAAALVDQGRAVSFGEATAGAGGDQRTFRSERRCGDADSLPDPVTPCVSAPVARAMKRFGVVTVSTTISLGVRTGLSDGEPIENTGIEPDIPYELRADDFTQDFAPMRRAIVHALEGSDPTSRGR